jgi:hypothetical protein
MSILGNGDCVMQSKRFVAVVRREDVELPSRNFVGLPPMEAGEPDTRGRLPTPLIIAILTKPDGIFLERFDETGADAGDSWHRSVEEAKEQAREEYGESVGMWTSVPDGEEDPFAFGLRLADVDP